MYSRKQVQEWIQWSRDSLPETGDYPMLDVAEIKGTNCPWRENTYSDFQESDKGSRDKLLVLFENYLSRDPADVSGRFTALNLHYAFSMHAIDDSEMKGHYDFLGVDHDGIRKDFAKKMAYLVRLLPVEDCTDRRTIRWEICNACAIRDWERAGRLYDQLEALALLELAEIQVLRGQLNYFVVFDSKTPGNLDPWFWEPKPYYSNPDDSLGWEEDLHEFILYMCGLKPARKRKKDEEEITLDEAERDKISDAANDFEKGLSKRSGFSPAYRSMLAGCYFAKGDFGNAAKNYEQALSDSTYKIFATPFNRIDTYKCIANSYQLADATEKAMDALKQCAVEFPAAKGIYKELAAIQAQAADYRSAYESLARESERDPAFGEDWLVSTVLALGSVGHNSEQIATYVERHLSSNPQLREGIKSLLKAHGRSVDHLVPEAQGKWTCGSCIILNLSVDKQLHGDLAQAAAAQFGTAVELELKSRVFGKFRDYVFRSSDLRSLVENKRLWVREEKFFKFLLTHKPMTMPLGQMHRAFNDCKKSNRDILKIFNGWVRQNQPTLLKNLGLLGKICDIHNDAKHEPSISKENAVSMPNFCRDFLSKLIR